MDEKINACQTLADIVELERTHSLNEEEQRFVFERRLQIFLRIQESREENKKLGLEPTISDSWTPEQRQRFLDEWNDEQTILESVQVGRGQKRSHDEIRTLKLLVCTNDYMKYSSRFWMKPSAAFHLKIRYVSCFIPTNWNILLIFRSWHLAV